eukprot:3630414-Rhodomonas_salina.1
MSPPYIPALYLRPISPPCISALYLRLVSPPYISALYLRLISRLISPPCISVCVFASHVSVNALSPFHLCPYAVLTTCQTPPGERGSASGARRHFTRVRDRAPRGRADHVTTGPSLPWYNATLNSAMRLRARYALSGTERAYAAMQVQHLQSEDPAIRKAAL